MSLPDHLLPVPCVDAFCHEHKEWFDSDEGCKFCAIDAIDDDADMRLQDRLEGR